MKTIPCVSVPPFSVDPESGLGVVSKESRYVFADGDNENLKGALVTLTGVRHQSHHHHGLAKFPGFGQALLKKLVDDQAEVHGHASLSKHQDLITYDAWAAKKLGRSTPLQPHPLSADPLRPAVPDQGQPPLTPARHSFPT